LSPGDNLCTGFNYLGFFRWTIFFLGSLPNSVFLIAKRKFYPLFSAIVNGFGQIKGLILETAKNLGET
jgi:hypothetical protein